VTRFHAFNQRLWRLGTVLFITAAISCSTNPRVASIPLAASAKQKCAALADSVQAHTLLSDLTFVTPIGRPVRPFPDPPYDARPGTPVIAQFLIRTDGLVDMSTIVVTGTSDPTFRASVARAVAGVRFHVPELRGCPVPGRGGIGERFG